MAPELAVKWVLLSTLLLGALATYAWLTPLFGDRGGALGAIVWLALPFTLATVYARGSLGEMLVLALLPLALAGLRALAMQGSLLGAAVAVVAILWMWRAQAGLALPAGLLLVAYAALVLRHRLALLTAAVAGGVGLLGVVGLFGVTAPPVVPFADQFITLYGLLRTGAAAGEPVQLGAATLGLAALGIFGLYAGDRLAGNEERRLMVLAAVTTLLLIAVALPWAAWLWRVSGAERLYTYPWQPLLVSGPLLAALAAAVPALLSDFRRTPLFVATVVAVLIAAQSALAIVWSTVDPPARPVAIVGANALALLDARVIEAPGAGETPATATLSLGWQVLRTPPFDDNLFFQAVREGADGVQVLAQLDVQPVADRPATTWTRGETLAGAYTLTLPAGIDPSTAGLLYHVGFYDWRDGARRAVTTGLAATPVGAEDKLVLDGAPAEVPHGE
jgi:hypothetical protein